MSEYLEMNDAQKELLSELNDAQRESVVSIFGPSLIIAGAGSGKTKVLTYKIAYILSQGYAPSSILALTFTNKAARQMRQRIGELVGDFCSRRLFAGTFHGIFLRLLRDYAQLLGYPASFTIYDKSDSKTLVKLCIKELGLDDKTYKPGDVCNRISECKNNLITPQTYNSYIDLVESDRRSKRGRMLDIYSLYTNKCAEQGIMDFDDILLNMYKLCSLHPEAFGEISDKFRFIFVDEYQDTNQLQYMILRELTKSHDNITVVGDDAQSIYAFRGARIENILNFQRDYPNAKVFRLERNYRSTQTIVEAANSVINKNLNRLTKECYSRRNEGDKIMIIPSFTEREEATLVASSIQSVKNTKHLRYEDFAILYRTNSQSRIIEEALRGRNIPFKIYQGHSFYERAEIKSMISYLRLIMNQKDDEAFKRVINFPSRGIGAVSMERIITLCSQSKVSLSEGVKSFGAEQFGIRVPTLNKIREFVDKVEEIRAQVELFDAYEIAKMMDMKFEITQSLTLDKSLDGQTRLDNVQEFFNSIKLFVEEGLEEFDAEGLSDESDDDAPLVTLDLFLQNIALISDSDVAKESSDVNKTMDENKEAERNRVSLMTVHAAKGLEFPYVYIVGMEENLFPSGGEFFTSQKDIEEERRLFYVALTRAKENVALSFAKTRLRYGTMQSNPPSRFLKEISSKYISNPSALNSNGGFSGTFGGRLGSIMGRSDSVRSNVPVRSHMPERSQITPRFSAVSRNNPEPLRKNFVADSPTDMRVGQRVEHERFGVGVITSISGEAQSKKAVVEFDQVGVKTLMLKFAKMKILDK